MKSLIVLGVLLVSGLELLVVSVRQQQLVPWIAGIAMGLLLFGIRGLLGASGAQLSPDRESTDDSEDSLRHWMSGAETRIHWSESTRMDWDRHWRPILARRFELATGQRRVKNSGAFDATGRMLFGAELWEWVDPGNIAHTGGDDRGPGRVVLEQILQRLEQQ